MVLNRSKYIHLKYLTPTYWLMVPLLILLTSLLQLIMTLWQFRQTRLLLQSVASPILVLVPIPDESRPANNVGTAADLPSASPTDSLPLPPAENAPVTDEALYQPARPLQRRQSVASLESLYRWYLHTSYFERVMTIANLNSDDRYFPILWLVSIIITFVPTAIIVGICVFCVQ